MLNRQFFGGEGGFSRGRLDRRIFTWRNFLMGKENVVWLEIRINSRPTIYHFPTYSVCYLEIYDWFSRREFLRREGEITWRNFFQKDKEILKSIREIIRNKIKIIWKQREFCRGNYQEEILARTEWYVENYTQDQNITCTILKNKKQKYNWMWILSLICT